MRIKRGDIIEVDFGKRINSSIQSGIRPAIVVSNNKANFYSTVLTVVPLSSKTMKKVYLPTHVFIGQNTEGLRTNSIVLAEQITSIDHNNILKRLGNVNIETMSQITTAIQVQIGVFDEYN